MLDPESFSFFSSSIHCTCVVRWRAQFLLNVVITHKRGRNGGGGRETYETVEERGRMDGWNEKKKRGPWKTQVEWPLFGHWTFSPFRALPPCHSPLLLLLLEMDIFKNGQKMCLSVCSLSIRCVISVLFPSLSRSGD